MKKEPQTALQLVPAAPQVSLMIQPDEQLTTDWLRQLIADARVWKENQTEAA